MIKAEVMDITPEIAKEFLKRNVRNRKLSQKKVNQYADDMKKGRWTLNGETIIFNKKGELDNGQHRLHAVILTGVTIRVLVVTGVEDERAFETIDQGLMRGAHTILQLKGVSNANRMVSIAKKLLLWDQTEDKGSFSISARKSLSNSEIADYYEENKEEINLVYDIIKDATILRTSKSYSGVIAALTLCFRYNPSEALQFIEKFKTGANLSENSPILLLRNKLSDPKTKDNGRRWEMEVMALIIKAFNNYAAGKTQRQLRWNIETEKFPTPLKKISFLKEVQQQWKMN